MSKIVVLNGSPRKNGNTVKLVDAFVKGAESAGNQVTTFSAVDTKVNGCLACDYCMRNEGKCVQKDDMQAVYDALYEADSVVFATPSYFFGMTAQIKAIIDRLYASAVKPFSITSSALLVPLGGEAETDAAAAIVNYKSVLDYMKWEDKGMVIVGGVMDRDDIVGHPAILKAEELGKSFQ